MTQAISTWEGIYCHFGSQLRAQDGLVALQPVHSAPWKSPNLVTFRQTTSAIQTLFGEGPLGIVHQLQERIKFL